MKIYRNYFIALAIAYTVEPWVYHNVVSQSSF